MWHFLHWQTMEKRGDTWNALKKNPNSHIFLSCLICLVWEISVSQELPCDLSWARDGALYGIQGFHFKISKAKISREERAMQCLGRESWQFLTHSRMVQVDLQAGDQIQQGTTRIMNGFSRGKTFQPAHHWQTRAYAPDLQIPIPLQQNLTAQNQNSIQNTFFSFREGEAGGALKWKRILNPPFHHHSIIIPCLTPAYSRQGATLWLKMSQLLAGGWTRWPLMVLSNLNQSLILWSTGFPVVPGLQDKELAPAKL